MKTGFLYQERDCSFSLGLVASSTTGSFSFGLGCSGLSQDTVVISGVSGNFLLTGGECFGSYNANEAVEIDGRFYDNSVSLYLNDRLVTTNGTAKNQGADYLFLSKISGDATIYNMTASISGSLKTGGLLLNYITSNASDESDVINMISGMNLFEQITISEDVYSGALASTDITTLNDYDAIILGFEQTINSFSGASGWNTITSPIIILEPEIASQSYLNIISGSAICTSETTGVCLDTGDVAFSRTNFVGGADDEIVLFSPLATGTEGDIFYYNISGFPEREMITGRYGKNFLSHTPTGSANYVGGLPQSGERIILSVLKTGDYDEVWNTLTDEWKKILISELYYAV